MGRYTACVLSLISCLAAVGTAKAEFISLECSADTYLRDSESGLGDLHGAQRMPVLGGSLETAAVPLVRFDLSAYEGRRVVGAYAYVRLYLIDGSSDPGASQSIEAHASLIDWTEASVSLGDFADDTWIRPESISSILSMSVVDWDETPRYVAWKIPRSLVQGWIDNPGSNKGLVFLSATGASEQLLCFASQENPIGAPPRLEFTLAAVPEPSTLVLLVLSGGVVVLSRRHMWR